MTSEQTLHPEAQSRFNEIARDLLQKVEPHEPTEQEKAFRPDLFPAAHLSGANIKGIRHLGTTDRLSGEITDQLFQVGDKTWILGDEGCGELEELITRIQNQKALNSTVSRQTLRNLFIDWIEQCIAEGMKIEFLDFALPQIWQSVTRQRIMVPIANLSVETDLAIGDVTFTSITREFFDKWREQKRDPESDEQREIVQRWFDERRKRFQGLAAASVEVTAEPAFAVTAAYEAADRATRLLRLFTGESLEPLAVSYLKPFGSEDRRSFTAWRISANTAPAEHSETLRPHPIPFELSDELKANLMELGLDALCRLAAKATPTTFEQSVTEALLLYSQSSVAEEVAEKLVLVFVALESLLLRDQNEGIQQNVGERMAFILGSASGERRSIAGLVKKAYRHRSEYIHHGHRPTEMEDIRRFFRYTWAFFVRVIKISGDFSTKEDFLDALEERKFA